MTPTTDTSREARITDADRLLFADLFDLPQDRAQETFSGRYDNHASVGPKLHALARHRLTPSDPLPDEVRAKAAAFLDAFDAASDEGGTILWLDAGTAANELRAALTTSQSGEEL
jgi:hypothetical protein